MYPVYLMFFNVFAISYFCIVLLSQTEAGGFIEKITIILFVCFVFLNIGGTIFYMYENMNWVVPS